MPTENKLIAGGAALLALILLALQIVGGLEYTEGASLYTRSSMVVAMVTLAALPLFIEAARSVKAPGLALAIGIAFLGLLAYSLPAVVGRTGEVKEVKVVVAGDVVAWKSEIALHKRTLAYAEPQALAECAGAPSPLPIQGWPECKRKSATVTALKSTIADLERKIANAGGASAQLGDIGSETWAWALSPIAKVEAQTIRRGSAVGFAAGLDIAIWSLLWLAGRMLRTGGAVANDNAPPPSGGKLIEERAALPAPSPVLVAADLDDDSKAVLAAFKGRQGPMTNGEIQKAMGLASKGEASKRVTNAVVAGVVVRERAGREVLIRPAASVH